MRPMLSKADLQLGHKLFFENLVKAEVSEVVVSTLGYVCPVHLTPP